MKNQFASTASSTITAALLLLLLLSGSAYGGSLVVLNEEDIVNRHDSVQTRTCEGGFAVTGEGEFTVLDEIKNSFSVHVCAEDHTSSTSEGGGADMAPGSVRAVTGKIFNSAKEDNGMTYEYFYHPHCMYMDNEGGVFVGVEIEEITGDRSDVYNPKEVEGDDNDRKLKTETKKSKNSKSKQSKKSKNDPDCTGCCRMLSSGNDRRKLIHANEEVTSGNESRGTLGVFYFQRKEDTTEDHARYGISLFDEFDTGCSDFADVVSRSEMMFTSKVNQGGFLFQEPL